MRLVPLSDALSKRVHDPVSFESVICDCGIEFASLRAEGTKVCPTCKRVQTFGKD